MSAHNKLQFEKKVDLKNISFNRILKPVDYWKKIFPNLLIWSCDQQVYKPQYSFIALFFVIL